VCKEKRGRESRQGVIAEKGRMIGDTQGAQERALLPHENAGWRDRERRGKKYKHSGSEWQAMKQVVGCGDDDDDDGGGEGEDDEAEDAG